ncbi:hypothetical protein M5K25_019324 [Dendrobium thyrsiflorum]|uniref:Uncharacterized protein n=1 Tax=Dendrobium thyrsiflorum TaxID=117978 RepID=A0ABD0ULB3_DENTH
MEPQAWKVSRLADLDSKQGTLATWIVWSPRLGRSHSWLIWIQSRVNYGFACLKKPSSML